MEVTNGVWRFYGILCILLPLGFSRGCVPAPSPRRKSERGAKRYTLQIQILQSSYRVHVGLEHSFTRGRPGSSTRHQHESSSKPACVCILPRECLNIQADMYLKVRACNLYCLLTTEVLPTSSNEGYPGTAKAGSSDYACFQLRRLGGEY